VSSGAIWVTFGAGFLGLRNDNQANLDLDTVIIEESFGDEKIQVLRSLFSSKKQNKLRGHLVSQGNIGSSKAFLATNSVVRPSLEEKRFLKIHNL
jgi:hypothetical protein